MIAEHRLPLLEVADRLVVLDQGRVRTDTPWMQPRLTLQALGLAIPPLLESEIHRRDRALIFDTPNRRRGVEASPEDALDIAPARVTYDGMNAPALDTEGFQIVPGERIAILGPNGSGKSTLLRHIRDTAEARSVMVPQNADLTLFNPTAFDEIAFGPREQGLAPEVVGRRVDAASASLGPASPPSAPLTASLWVREFASRSRQR